MPLNIISGTSTDVKEQSCSIHFLIYSKSFLAIVSQTKPTLSLSLDLSQLSLTEMIRDGMPTAVAPSGTSFSTTDPAPTFASAPILMLPKILTPAPTLTFAPSLGCLSPPCFPVPPSYKEVRQRSVTTQTYQHSNKSHNTHSDIVKEGASIPHHCSLTNDNS